MGLAHLIKGSSSPVRSLRSTIRIVHAGWVVLLAGLGLSLIGVYTIDVATNPTSSGAFDLSALAWKQVVFLIVGLLGAVVIALPHYKLFATIAWPLAFLSLGLLMFLLVPGVPRWLVSPINGARAWITLPMFNFQPSEPAKIAYVLFMALYLRQRDPPESILSLIPPGLLTLIPIGLITLQPDLGTASLFVPSLFGMLVTAGAHLRQLALIVLLASLSAPLAWPFLLPHQKSRFEALLQQIQGDRSREQDINFQSFTAQRLIGAGGITGQSDDKARALVRFNRLPEAHNDMIFSVVATRFGVLGSLAVIGLFLIWFAGALVVAAACKDRMGRITAVGLAGFIAAHVVVNVGMNIGLLPIIGVTLPFVSYGGSSMLTCWLMNGLLFNIAMRRELTPYNPAPRYPLGQEPYARKK
ncbi:MAG: FtsW/RodA/SpoVE family cell cycle protein [Phycisphaerales bacterium]|nr:FtsW/RodA/SpoVE family cell cycle protein [Phycisphaerales bacterium]